MNGSTKVGAIPYEKSNNIEISLLGKQGRITRKSFFIRMLICLLVWVIAHIVYVYWAEATYIEYLNIGGGKIQAGALPIQQRYEICQIIDFYVLPIFLFLFMLIQAIKRAHDVNHSGWCLLIPLYNLYLIFARGTKDDNDYGLFPRKESDNLTYKRKTEKNE